MKSHIGCLILILLCSLVPAWQSKAQEFPIGIFTFSSGNTFPTKQLTDTLHLTWIQGGSGSGSTHVGVDTVQGLKTLNSRDSLSYYTKAQQLQIFGSNVDSVHLDHPFFRRYTTPKTGGVDAGGNGWEAQVGTHQKGYMASDLWPWFGFSPGKLNWTATFSFRTTKGAPATDTVVEIKILCLRHNEVLKDTFLIDNNFTTTGADQLFSIHYALPNPGGQQPVQKYLRGAYQAPPTPHACDSLDVRLYWWGKRTTRFNSVLIEDSLAHDYLFSGTKDAVLSADANGYAGSSYPDMRRLYLADEPSIYAFKSFNYVDALLQSLSLDAGGIGRGRGVTAYPGAQYSWANYMGFFINDAHPHEVLFDPYEIKSNIPSPSMTGTLASSGGVVAYQSNTQYNTILDSTWNTIEGELGAVASNCKASSPQIPFWFAPQLHGVFVVDTGVYAFRQPDPYGEVHTLRPPTGNELTAQINLALAFGAKGIIPYPHTTDSAADVHGSPAYFTGLVSQMLVNGKYSDHSRDSALLYYGTTNKQTKWVWTGYKEKFNALAAMNLKLQTLAPTLLTLTTWQGTKSWKAGVSYGTWTNVLTAITAKNTGGAADATASVTTGDFFTAGGVEYLYVVNRRCDQTGGADIRDICMTFSTSKANWLITDPLTSNAWVVAGGGVFTDRFNPGEGKLYRIESAAISGTRTFNVLTVNAGATFAPSAGSQLLFMTGGGITSNGQVSAIGTFGSPILFTTTGTPGLAKWDKIGLNGGPNTLSYCTIKYANFGLYVTNNSSNTFSYCTVDSCQNYGLYEYNSTCAVSYSTFTHCNQGVLGSSGGLGIASSTIQNNRQNGIYITGATLYLGSANYVQNNTQRGVYVTGAASNVYFSDAYLGAGCNVLSNNGYGEVYAASGTGLVLIGDSAIGAGARLYCGYNRITDALTSSGHLVNNLSSHIIFAKRNYWGGSGVPSAFNGLVDTVWTFYSSPSCPNQSLAIKKDDPSESRLSASSFHGSAPMISLDPTGIARDIPLWKYAIAHGQKDAVKYLYMLSAFVLSDPAYTTAFGENWSTYLDQLATNSASQSLREAAQTQQVRLLIAQQDYAGAKTLADPLLAVGPSADLKVYLLESKFHGLLASKDFDGATSIYSRLEGMESGIEQDELDVLALELSVARGDQAAQGKSGSIVGKRGIDAAIPQRFALEQNYPNPFNPTTTISYEIPEDGKVTLTMYDVLGREVSSLVNADQAAGHYTVEFNASRFASGVYFYRLTAGAHTDVKKLLLAK